MKINGKKFSPLLLFSVVFFFLVTLVRAQTSCDSTCDPSDSGCLTNLQNLCQTKVTELHNQANTLSNQIAQFNAQIKLTTLKISQTQSQISLLGGRIDQLGQSLNDLTAAFSSRAVETYKLSRFENNFMFILSATDITDAASRLHYLQKIQEEDRSLLGKLQTAQTTYQGQKTDQETLQKQLTTQQANLNAQKIAKNNLLAITKNDEAKYQSLLAAAKAQLSKFKSFATSHGGSSILENQTKCNEGWSGCYYNQRDSLWGNMFLGSSGYLMKDSGCFATSVAMLASHSGKNIKPNDVASSPDTITPGGDVIHSFNINGVNVSISNASKSSLDSELAAGRPVMAELNSGSHFIVIIRKEGDSYIMNDPFLKDGYNKPLSDGGYSYANITGLRLVGFN